MSTDYKSALATPGMTLNLEHKHNIINTKWDKHWNKSAMAGWGFQLIQISTIGTQCNSVSFPCNSVKIGFCLDYTIKKAPQFPEGLNLKSATTYSPTIAVPSALAGLTSLFGMGRGGTPPL